MLVISSKVRFKLANKQPPVTQQEIEQCFANRVGSTLIDTREQHQTDPETRWFIAETDFGRRLKVCFIFEGNDVIIKTAYKPSVEEIQIYNELGLP